MEKNIKIALIEDDPNLRFLVKHRLLREGFEIIESGNGNEAEDLILEEKPDIVLLDWMLPGKEGSDICISLREKGFDNIIIMMTAKAQDLDKIFAYKFGVSDYVTKPFNMDLVIALINSKVNFIISTGKEETNKFGDMEHHPNTHTILKGDGKIELTIIENRILIYFLKNIGEIVSREDLMMEVWGYQADVNTRTLDMHIVRLRKKIEFNPENPEFLLTVRGLGYKFMIN